MSDALVAAFEQNKPGVYNVAPDDYVTYQVAVEQSGCRKLPVPSIPPLLPKLISGVLNWHRFFQPYLINYFKFPVIIAGSLFCEPFGWKLIGRAACRERGCVEV